MVEGKLHASELKITSSIKSRGKGSKSSTGGSSAIVSTTFVHTTDLDFLAECDFLYAAAFAARTQGLQRLSSRCPFL